jgi:sterol desaturase/sphingolipid hydroxylase (fatty acid hydroxylase superfamily)
MWKVQSSKEPDKRFGVTNIFWDLVFGTRVKED